jgi:hypothetical protein
MKPPVSDRLFKLTSETRNCFTADVCIPSEMADGRQMKYECTPFSASRNIPKMMYKMQDNLAGVFSSKSDL